MQRIASALIVIAFSALPSSALVSTNVPLGHWSYDAVDKLANYGLIDSAMLTIKPLSRVEMARHVGQAMLTLERLKDAPPLLPSLVDRLKHEYQGELILIGLIEGWHGESFVKPLEDPYVAYLHARRTPDIENVRGDEFQRGSNYRAGFATRGAIMDRFAFYLHPEYIDSSQTDGDVELIEGYGKLMIGDLEIEAGKDSLWWGPGRHGSILMSNNAQPLTMIKLTNPQPRQLPWIFRALGPVRGQWFLAQLEKDRHIPEAKLTGMRLSVKPHPLWDLGFSRVILFGGRGMPRVDLFDYTKLLLAVSNQERDNQIAGFDTSVLVPLSELPLGERLPFRSLRFYVDGAGEDEAGGLPSNWGFLYGLQFNDILKTGRTDLRIEYANNHVKGKPNVFYNHSIYRSGYTYEDRVIGHHMGTDSSDLFVELSHYLTEDLVVDLAFNRQTSNLKTDEESSLDIYQTGLTFFASPDWRVETAYRYEDARAGEDDNHIIQVGLTRRF
ncbi:MAG TPA: capsule assembly Wzi family protein [Sedimentisphaerales bacterium]|nr:capsule assembly Wzi family protein [Sedimentisphaerales bacterium]